MEDLLGLMLMFGGPVLWVLWYLTAKRTIMSRKVFESGLGKCVKCGYSKDGLASDGVCPECGTSLRLCLVTKRFDPLHHWIVVLCAIMGGMLGAVFVWLSIDLSEDAQSGVALLFGIPIIGVLGSAVGAWLGLAIIGLKRYFRW